MVQQVDDAEVQTFLKQGFDDGLSPSKIMRKIFDKFGPIGPPLMADHYSAVFGVFRMDILPVLDSWWIDDSSDITDEEFDEKMFWKLNPDKPNPKLKWY